MADQDLAAEEKESASTVPQKRVLPARERRESAAKRRASSPITALKSSSTPKKPTPSKSTPKTVPTKYNKRKVVLEITPTRHTSTPVVEEGLPAKITDSRPLPTSYQPPPLMLSAREYQNIAESAVLAASLHRSRLRWLAEGIFEKYWTKPSKKKGTEGLVNNPDLKTMHRLGSSAIIIGPHTFEATIYTVRDNPTYRHPNQYPQRPVAPQPGFQNYLPAGTQNPNLQARPVTNYAGQVPQVEVKQEKPVAGATIKPPTQSPKVSGNARPQASAPPASQSASAQSGPDPVIRMLATRAATNPDLKALMKVVASSKATPEQLKLFQSHIDELNVMIRQQQEVEKSPREPQNSHADQSLPKPTQLDGPGDDIPQTSHPPHDGKQRPLPYPTHPQRSGALHQTQQRPAPKIGPLGPPLNAPPYPHYLPPQQKVPAPEPRVKAIVLEFTSPASSTVPASQDRYLFPEYAVLDTPLSGQGLEMVCSFFVVRKGFDLLAMQSSEGTSTGTPLGGLIRWKPNEEYFQPVTMTMKTSQHRILETIARAARPLGEVQNKMKEIMHSKTRVKDEWLVMRLPREKGTSAEGAGGRDRGFVDSAVEIEEDGASGDEDDELKAFYGI
ncbi:hypothetical protein EPUS_03465 [Endocarpon pusillum Z07020]|uniref:SWR1-complex protein 3 domain-containing protein n=1 Tax=Endocarpon pusillum (strain Z07020 / HMAS-L-300199) TaxID=1263415 RepID=U1GHM3_ENDPU|nr:uncharacterized protein EPUS_03465 [Endocarpon pusillum Z07020]ERF71311.1 hypothetical protein EPUS_03465 [Endocarpon pusillum Z07020]